MSLSAQHNIVSIKKDDEIKKILANGKKIYTKYGIFFLAESPKIDPPGFAILIKKNVGNAVFRNYCKRLVREYTRKRLDIFSKYSRILFLYNFRGDVAFDLMSDEFNRRLEILWKQYCCFWLKYIGCLFHPCFLQVAVFIPLALNTAINQYNNMVR